MSLLREAAALWAVALYALLCVAVYGRHWRRLRLAERQATALLPAAEGSEPLLVLHASQNGQAEALALQTAQALHTAGVPVRLAPLGSMTRDDLRAATRALLIVSTYGEGDPPDNAVPFVRGPMDAPDEQDLTGLHIGVLALGDSSYQQFCGFGRALDGWLRRQGANSLFERIEADNSATAALAQWRQQLSHLAGTLDLPDWAAPDFESWQLLRRECLNPGSHGEPVFHLELAPLPGVALPAWEAGDLAQLRAPADPERPREYSIASLPAAGRVHLLVRQARRADGSPGLASGWLCAQIDLGGCIELRLRAHGGFRIGGNADRPLILIGNGTGLAGLRAHLQARAAASAQPGVWLIAGERQAAHDAHYRAEIDDWQRRGVLTRVDWAFSRDQAMRRYVQHVLAEQSERLRDWVARDAAIYICGSLQGMAAAVDALLRETLGDALLDQLIAQGRYRRDVY
jgi:sulfite reductase (NADPH) flavoprotein alpha-component